METKGTTPVQPVESETRALLEAAEKFMGGELVAASPEVDVLVLPKGRAAYSLKAFRDEYAERPDRKIGTAVLTTIVSLIDHVNRTKDGNSVLFANDSVGGASLTCVYDYNEAGEQGLPRFRRHRALYKFPLSDEWQAWQAVASKEMSQVEFAQFLEDRVQDVLDPASAGAKTREFAATLGVELASPGKLMALSRGLSVNVGQALKNHANLATGEATLQFEEKHSDSSGAPLRVPGGFALAIPVVRGGDLYQVPVRLRYRVQQGQVVWKFVPHRTDVVFRTVIEEAADKVEAATGLPLFYGQPEGEG